MPPNFLHAHLHADAGLTLDSRASEKHTIFSRYAAEYKIVAIEVRVLTYRCPNGRGISYYKSCRSRAHQCERRRCRSVSAKVTNDTELCPVASIHNVSCQVAINRICSIIWYSCSSSLSICRDAPTLPLQQRLLLPPRTEHLVDF